MRVCLSLALFTLTAAAVALMGTAALVGAVPAAVLLERALMNPEHP
jgi:hypothetical protein